MPDRPTPKQTARQREKQALQHYGERYARNCPKHHFTEAVGIHRRVAIDQSRRFGLAYHTSGKTVDLFAMLRGFHQWALRHKAAILQVFQSRDAADQHDENDTLEFWQRQLTKERALKERDGRLDRHGDNVPREVVHVLLQEFYVEPHTRRLDQLSRREDTISPEELASWYREDLKAFQQAMESLVADDYDQTQSKERQ
ncbi:hypothetical protein [Aeoliella sp.]|uniref:hypothetical protein n=1 Tax=Aeoliella sp. TaxID=2795800 RepID=UPI003CCB9ECE